MNLTKNIKSSKYGKKSLLRQKLVEIKTLKRKSIEGIKNWFFSKDKQY